MSWRGLFLCWVGVAAFAPIAAAEGGGEQRAMLEEFLTAEPSYVQSRGEFEVSAAYDYREPAGSWRLPVLVEYGITGRIEAEVEASYLSVPGDGSRDHGPGDVELGLHYALRPDVERVAVTLGANVGLPTGDEARGLGGGRTEVELFGTAGMRLGRAELHVTAMLAVEDETEPGLNAAAVYPHRDLRFALEAHVLRGSARSGEQIAVPDVATETGGDTGDKELWLVLTPGLFHCPGAGVQYGIGVPIGLTGSAPDWGIIGRLTVEL